MSTVHGKAGCDTAEKVFHFKNNIGNNIVLAVNRKNKSNLTYNVDRRCALKKRKGLGLQCVRGPMLYKNDDKDNDNNARTDRKTTQIPVWHICVPKRICVPRIMLYFSNPNSPVQ